MTAINAVTDLSTTDGIAVLTLDSPPVNALSPLVMDGLYEGLVAAMADPAATALVLICAGRTFIAGADLKSLNDPGQQSKVPFSAVQRAIEDAGKPLIAAIHGTALGGGLEVALSFHSRVAVATARFGLPEVKIGLLPGGGGTQRLPRLVGAKAALDLIVGAEQIDAAHALSVGLIDEIVDGDLRAGAVAFASRIVAERRPLKKIGALVDKIDADRADLGLFERYRTENARRLRHSEAAERVIQCVEAAVRLPLAEGLAFEGEAIRAIMGGEQNKALLHNFFAERQAAKVADVPADTPLLPVSRIAVIGAGTMGRGIALAFVNAGLPVTLVESDRAALDKALAAMRASYDGALRRGKTTPAAIDAAMALVRPSGSLDDIAEVDLIVEAIYEDMAVKQSLFARLDAIAKPGAILATNTSYLDVDAIADATGRPESVIGLHFFSPANIMRLLEVVRGAKTSTSVVATAMKLGTRLGKVPVLSGVGWGFIGNRMLRARTLRAEQLILEGVAPETVDRVVHDFGLPMGPFAMGDLTGLDVGWSAETSTGSTTRELLNEAGRRGQKTGAGYYDYGGDDRTPRASPEAQTIIRGLAERRGVEQREIGDDEILDTLLFPMVNEGAKILDEGIAQRASDIDVVWINGYGFPAWRGGPMYWADRIGLDKVVAGMERLEARYGAALAPAPLLRRLAAEGKGFGAR